MLNRRELLILASGSIAATGTFKAAATDESGRSALRLIDTEAHFLTPEYITAFLSYSSTTGSEGMKFAASYFTKPEVREKMTNMEVRIRDMDANGISMHLMSLGSPGVQVFSDVKLATTLARDANDQMAQVVRRYPTRLAGLAAVAPQDPVQAADEIRRAVTELGLSGVVINSHTHGEWLDAPKFYPILEAAQKYRAPIYLHPTFPPESMSKPLQDYGMYTALWGFAAECGLHAVRMVLGGVFDRFPELQVVLGHMGEGLPFFLFRLDDNYEKTVSMSRVPPGIVKLKRKPSDYIKENMYITTSAMFWNELLEFCIKALGADRIMFAVDYPYSPSKAGASFLGHAPIPAGEKEMIAHLTAERLFQIRP